MNVVEGSCGLLNGDELWLGNSVHSKLNIHDSTLKIQDAKLIAIPLFLFPLINVFSPWFYLILN